MPVSQPKSLVIFSALLAALVVGAPDGVAAQEVVPEHGFQVERLVSEPAELTTRVGESVPFRVRAFDAAGNELFPELQVRGQRGGVWIDGNQVVGVGVGSHQVVVAVLLPPGTEGEPATLTIPVEVTWPAIETVEVVESDGRLYEGAHARFKVRAVHGDGSERGYPVVRWSTSDPEIATADRFGRVAAHAAGRVTVTAEVEGVEGFAAVDVEPFPGERMEVSAAMQDVRTGDVVHLEATVLDGQGREVRDAPVTWTYEYVPHDSIGAPKAPGQVADGRFVADVPGRYTIFARSGPLEGWATVEVQGRDVVQRIMEVGQGSIRHRRTSDFWVYEGVDGRDYAVSGTWGTGGFAYFWDVTDPENIILTDSVQVDARTVNDVKVSPDGRYAVLTREGASDRRNGVVIMDLSNPAHPTVASEYTEGLTGGVHNTFPTNDYLFALSAGEKYVILDVTDIYAPRYVSEYRHPNGAVHDLWVKDGIAYSAQWDAGVVVVDVGHGGWGGSIENPVFINNYELPSGRTHEVIPYYQESTGRILVFAGDEIIGRQGYALEGGTDRFPYDPEVPGSGRPRSTAGYIHIVDFTDMENPKKIARYHVPDYGTHNSWVEDDVLYQAYYEGGLRVVDISGDDLMGNLYTQGREIAVFKPYDPIGFQSNAPMVWSPQLHKGHIFLSDANSGLWSLKLEPRAAPVF
jgi:hypothetical protein